MISVGVNLSNLGEADGAYICDEENFFNGKVAADDLIYIYNADASDIDIYTKMPEGMGWLIQYGDQALDPEYITDSEYVIIPAGSGMFYIPVETTTWTVTLN